MAVEAEPVDPGTKLLDEFPVDADTQTAFPEPVAAEPVVAEVPAPAKPMHPSWLVRAAKAAGMDDGEIGGMNSDELKSATQLLASTRDRDRQERETVQSARQRDPETGRFLPAEDVSHSEKTEDKPFSLKDVGIDPTKWEEGTSAETIATDIVKALLGRIDGVTKEVGTLKEREVNRERNAQFDRLDKLFTQDEATYGKGTRQSLKPGTPEAIRRQSVIAAMDQFKGSGITLEEAFQKATDALFGGLTKQEPVEIADPKGFLNGHVARPTVRQTKAPPKGPKLAAANLAARMSEYATDEPTSELDELPD
jgi:hypothetical protein